MILIRRVVVIGTCAVVGAAMIVAVVGLPQRLGHADVAVVFGTTVSREGHPSTRLAARLDEAVTLFQQGLFPTIVVSGGLGKEGFFEGSVMRDYLVEHGIPTERISVDNAGDTTSKTAKNTSALMRERKMKSVLLISQFFHLPRARLAFAHTGISDVYYGHPNYYDARDVYSLVRELFALLKYSILR